MAWTDALALRRIAVGCSNDRRVQAAGASDDVVELGYFAKPQQDTIADFDVWTNEYPVVVFDIPTMELKDQSAVGKEPFVLRTTMITSKAEKMLIPAAGRFDVAHSDHGLRLRRSNGNDDADSVAGRIVDLYEPTLPVVELGASVHCAAAGQDTSESLMQVVG